MRTLGREAEWRGYSMLAFAQNIGVDLRVLQRYFVSEHPETKTIRRMVRALDYPPIVSRVLQEGLTSADVRNELSELAHRLVHGSGTHVFGANIMRVHDEITSAIAENKMAAELFPVVSVVARYGLWFGDIDGALGPYFSAIETVLTVTKCRSLRSFIVNENRLIERKRRAVRELNAALNCWTFRR